MNYTEREQQDQVIEPADVTISASEVKRQELEDSFEYGGYQVVRKELFAHLRDPAVTIRPDSITFNSACINGMNSGLYINILVNEGLKRIVVECCDENDKDALKWCKEKNGKLISRKMICKDFAHDIYAMMKWDKSKRYKILGYKINFEGKTLYVFDLLVPEIFNLYSKRNKEPITVAQEQELNTGITEEVVQESPSEEKNNNQMNRKGYYDRNSLVGFGPSVDEYRKQTEIKELNGYFSMGMLTEGEDHKTSVEEVLAT